MTVETLGELLQKTRGERGLTVDQVAALTRISPAYIRALEENRLEALPGEVFVRGFVQVYGRCLGLAEPEVMARFKRAAQEFYRAQEDLRQTTRNQVKAQEVLRDRKSLVLQTAIVAALGLGIVLVYSLNSRRTGEDGPVVPSKRSATPAPEKFPDGDLSPAPGEPPPAPGPSGVPQAAFPPSTKLKSPPVGLPSVGSHPASPAVNLPSAAEETAPAPDPLTLRLEAIETSWVAVTIDDKIAKEVVLRPGEIVIWKAADNFVLSLGNAGGVLLSLNGRELPPMGASGAVVKNVLLRRESPQ